MMNDMLSQDEINALLNGDTSIVDDAQTENGIEFDDIEKDAIGEIGNISMGSAATTLFTLLGQRVEITTPSVRQTTMASLAEKYPLPFISVFIRYSLGIEGINLLILKEDDVKVITSLMLGGDGKTDLPEELSEMHLSAISEAMNQMMGAASTSLSEMMDKKIDITPPTVARVTFNEDRLDPEIIDPNQEVICTSFKMTVGDLIDSEIMQVLPIEFGKSLVKKMMGVGVEETPKEELVSQPQKEQEKPFQDTGSVEPQMQVSPSLSQTQVQPEPSPQIQQPVYGYAPQQAYSTPPMQEPVRVQPAQFSSFDAQTLSNMQVPENIGLIKDVMLQVTVELGKTVKPIDEILDFKPGSILELDKLVGEPLDILTNGKKIALGEVVVIDENYGIRITDIVKPEKRLQSL